MSGTERVETSLEEHLREIILQVRRSFGETATMAEAEMIAFYLESKRDLIQWTGDLRGRRITMPEFLDLMEAKQERLAIKFQKFKSRSSVDVDAFAATTIKSLTAVLEALVADSY